MSTVEATAKRPMTTFTLCEEVERYVGDNVRSGNLEDRWLADHLKGVIPLLRQVRNSNLDEETRQKVKEFQALEIEEQLRVKRNEIETLERSLRKVRT